MFSLVLACQLACQLCLHPPLADVDTVSKREVVTEIINTAILPFMKKNAVPGVAVAVYDGNEGYTLCFGLANKEKALPVTPETIFEIASVTKVFTTTDLALHVENDSMSLDDPITKYLPAVSDTSAPINYVSLRQLATHTSSLPRTPPKFLDNNQNRRQEIIEFLQKWQPDHPIGTHYSYSNLGVGLIGYALENVEHKSYDELLKDDFLHSLGMNSTMVNVPFSLANHIAQGYTPKGTLAKRWTKNPLPAAGALCSTPADMLKFLQANLGLGISKHLWEAVQITQKGYYKVNNYLTMGLAWQRINTQAMLIIDKNGQVPGFSSYIGMIPEKRLGVVILANKSGIPCPRLGRFLLLLLSQL